MTTNEKLRGDLNALFEQLTEELEKLSGGKIKSVKTLRPNHEEHTEVLNSEHLAQLFAMQTHAEFSPIDAQTINRMCEGELSYQAQGHHAQVLQLDKPLRVLLTHEWHDEVFVRHLLLQYLEEEHLIPNRHTATQLLKATGFVHSLDCGCLQTVYKSDINAMAIMEHIEIQPNKHGVVH